MFITGHVGLTFGVLATIEMSKKGREITGLNPWLVTLFAILPDLIDKPMALLFIPYPKSFRLYGHTLSFFILLQISITILHRKWQIYGWIYLGHLFLDGMWNYPHSLFYPLLGFYFDPAPGPKTSPINDYSPWNIRHILSDPISLLPELIGLAWIFLYPFVSQYHKVPIRKEKK